MTVAQSTKSDGTADAYTAAPAFWVKFMSVSETGPEFDTDTPPIPVVFWIVPPDDGAPVPVTVSPPADPVPEISTPSTGLPPAPAEIDWKVSPFVPIRVPPSTSSAMAVVVLRVLVGAVALTVPPPVAVNAGCVPVLATIAPVKLITAAPSFCHSTPVPESLIAPLSVSVPPMRPWITTEWPPVLVIWAAIAAVPPPPVTSRPSPVAFAIETVGSSVNELTPVALIPAPPLSPTLRPRTASPSASVTPRRPHF